MRSETTPFSARDCRRGEKRLGGGVCSLFEEHAFAARSDLFEGTFRRSARCEERAARVPVIVREAGEGSLQSEMEQQYLQRTAGPPPCGSKRERVQN